MMKFVWKSSTGANRTTCTESKEHKIWVRNSRFAEIPIYIARADAHKHLSTIINLRENTRKWELKELSTDFIQTHIHEFFLTLMDGNVVGCGRIFRPQTYPHILELGSVAVDADHRWCGVGDEMVTYAETIARYVQTRVIAVTGGNLDATLQRHDWQEAAEVFPNRMTESVNDRKLWIYPGN